MSRGRKKHALIWWLNTSYKDVIDLSVIPKNKRDLNEVAYIMWVDNQGKKIRAEAKLVAIGGKYLMKIDDLLFNCIQSMIKMNI